MTIDDVLEMSLGPCRERLIEAWPVLENLLAGRQSVILYPAARMARGAAAGLREMGVEVLGFGDSNAALWGEVLDGLAVWSPDQISSRHRDIPILIASTLHDSPIAESLRKSGCSTVIPVGILNQRLPEVFVSREYSGTLESVSDRSNHDIIRHVYELLADEESKRVFLTKLTFNLTKEKSLLDDIRSDHPIYFDEDIVTFSSDEVVVDGGAYIGDTLASFIASCTKRFRGYYAFEPDRSNLSKLQSNKAFDGLPVVPELAGLAKQTGHVRFLSTACGDARVLADDEPGGETIHVVGLDEYFAGKPRPTFIKMDIAGNEANALHGAAQLIANHQPKLAISVYHQASDLWSLPALIHSLNPHYRLYIRHYSREIDDTVCYAIPADPGNSRG